MAIELNCRACGESFQVESRYAGRRRPCPICGAENEIPRTSTVTGDFSSEELQSLQTVGQGIGLILLAITIYILFVIFAFVGPQVAPRLALSVIGLVGPVVGIGAPVLIMIGQLMCLSVPSRSDAKGLVITSFTLQAVGTVLSVLLVGLSLSGLVEPVALGFAAAAGWLVGLTVVSGLCALVGSILFVLFMARLAHFIDRPETAGKAMLSLWLAASCVLIWLLMFAAAVGQSAVVTLVLGVVLFVVALLAFLRYVGALSELRTGIRAIV